MKKILKSIFRLDFETFVLSNPVTITTLTIGPSTVKAGSGNSIGQCQTDTFAVTSPCGKGGLVYWPLSTGLHFIFSTTCHMWN